MIAAGCGDPGADRGDGGAASLDAAPAGPDAAAAPDASRAPDGGSNDGGALDGGGEAHYPDECPPHETIVCTEETSWCDDGRVFTCAYSESLGWVGFCQQCAPFGTCATLGSVTYCRIEDEPCGADYTARCEGNVAIYCYGTLVRSSYCESARDCWARGPFAGCGRREECIHNGGDCGFGSGGQECCEGYCEVESARCVLPEGARCDPHRDACASGTRCLANEDGATTCQAPTCHRAPTSTWHGDDCGRWPEPLPCCQPELTCSLEEDGSGICCLPEGAEAVRDGVDRSDQCCHGVRYELGRPFCAAADS